jgi:hypothetical protein
VVKRSKLKWKVRSRSGTIVDNKYDKIFTYAARDTAHRVSIYNPLSNLNIITSLKYDFFCWYMEYNFYMMLFPILEWKYSYIKTHAL